LGPTPASGGNPSSPKKGFLFFKNYKIFSNFFRFGFGFRKAKLISKPNPSQWWQPFLSKNAF
jgi:hypothetical protein